MRPPPKKKRCTNSIGIARLFVASASPVPPPELADDGNVDEGVYWVCTIYFSSFIYERTIVSRHPACVRPWLEEGLSMDIIRQRGELDEMHVVCQPEA